MRHAPHAGVSALFGANLAAALQRRVGGAGVLDVYASPGLVLTHAVGPVSNLDRGPAGAIAAAGRAMRGTYSPRAMQLAGVERGLSVGLSFEVGEPVAGEWAVLQAATSYVGDDGVAVHRVVRYLSPDPSKAGK